MTLRDEIDRALRSGESPAELADRLALGDPVERVHLIEAVRHFAVDADLELADRCSPLLGEASGLHTPADLVELAGSVPADPDGVGAAAFDSLDDAERVDLEAAELGATDLTATDLTAGDVDLLEDQPLEAGSADESFVDQGNDPAVDEPGPDGGAGFDVFD